MNTGRYDCIKHLFVFIKRHEASWVGMISLEGPVFPLPEPKGSFEAPLLNV